MKPFIKMSMLIAALCVILSPLKPVEMCKVIETKRSSGEINETFALAIEQYKDQLPATFVGYNLNTEFLQPYTQLGIRRRNALLRTEHYDAYQDVVLDTYNNLSNEVLLEFNNLRQQNSSIDDLGKLIDSEYLSTTISTLTREYGYEASQEVIDYVEDVNDFPFEDITDSFPSIPSKFRDLLGNVTIITNGQRSGTIASFSMLYTAFIGLGMSEFAIVTLEGGIATLAMAAIAPLLPYIKLAILILAILIIASVLLVYHEQIMGIWFAIMDFLISLAPTGYENEFVETLEDIGNTVIKSNADGSQSVNGVEIPCRALTKTNYDAVSKQIDDNEYFYAFRGLSHTYPGGKTSTNTRQYLFISINPISFEEAVAFIQLTATHSIYTLNGLNAKNVAETAYPQYAPAVGPFADEPPNNKWGEYFYHYHPNIPDVIIEIEDPVLGILIKRKKSDRPHCFFGMPEWKNDPNTSLGQM